MRKLQLGDRFDVVEFVYYQQRYINHDLVKTGWQAIGSVQNGTILDFKGRKVTCWSDEIIKVGTLKITSIK